MTDLSIIIISYNTRGVTKACLEKLITATHNLNSRHSGLSRVSDDKDSGVLTATLADRPQNDRLPTYEIIVVDNASSDESAQMLESIEYRVTSHEYKLIKNKKNIGFGPANNIGVTQATGRYILFLNSDVMVEKIDFTELLRHMDEDSSIGALTVKVVLPSGKIDPASHRGFPTLWRSATYYIGLEKIFGRVPLLSRLFGGYHLMHKNLSKIHDVDAISGAFFLTRKELFEKVGGFDEAFFMYGEDLDLCYRIQQAGCQIIYYPLYSVVHLKYQSGIQRGDEKIENITKKHFYQAMKIFYDKHYAPKSLSIVNRIVHLFIDMKSKV